MKTNLLVASVPGSVELWMLPPYIKKNKKSIFALLRPRKSYGFLFTVISKSNQKLNGKMGCFEFPNRRPGEHLPLYSTLFNWTEDSGYKFPEEIFTTITVLEYKKTSVTLSELINVVRSDTYYTELSNKMNQIMGVNDNYSYLSNIGEDIMYIAQSYFGKMNIRQIANVANHFSLSDRTLAPRSVDTVSISTHEIDLKFELIVSDTAETNKGNDIDLSYDIQSLY